MNSVELANRAWSEFLAKPDKHSLSAVQVLMIVDRFQSRRDDELYPHIRINAKSRLEARFTAWRWALDALTSVAASGNLPESELYKRKEWELSILCGPILEPISEQVSCDRSWRSRDVRPEAGRRGGSRSGGVRSGVPGKYGNSDRRAPAA